MSLVNKLIDHSSKILLVLGGLAIAILPIIYLLGNQSLHHQTWNDSFENYQERSQEVLGALTQPQTFIYFKDSPFKLTASEVKQTLQFADFVCFELQKQGASVVRKNLEPKLKKKAKKGQQQVNSDVKTVQTLYEYPPLRQLKNLITKFVDFQHKSLSEKLWVITVFGELESNIQKEIDSIRQQNEGYKFIIVSPYPVSGDTPKITSNTNDSEQNVEDVHNTNETESKKESSKVQKKGKKEKQTKVKKVKVVEQVKEEEALKAETEDL